MATSTISANRLGANGIATILVRYDVGSAQTISGSARWQVRSGSPRALRCVAVHLSPCGSRVKKPNAAYGFAGRSALERMLGGRVVDLADVRRYLDAERG